MNTIRANDVNEAFKIGMMLLSSHGHERESRNGTVIELPEPCSTVYSNPQQRVLFHPERNANPFFHCMEGLWMLAGRDDVAFVSQFVGRMKEFSDDGETFHGAYGKRMRRYLECDNASTAGVAIDQLATVIKMLRSDPDTRRAVVAIWDPLMDLDTISKDIPCNDTIFFKIRGGKLQMTVCCRSNDAIWGAWGANAVHFSMIMEYVAAGVGVPMGTYTQISDSLHAYTDNPQWTQLKDAYHDHTSFDPYGDRELKPANLVDDFEAWDNELMMFLIQSDNGIMVTSDDYWHNKFFPRVAIPMLNAWVDYKAGYRSRAHKICDTIQADDWRLACQQWILRRMGK